MNKWIPVQKKLPEREGRYLVTLPDYDNYGNTDGFFTSITWWGTPKNEESTYFYYKATDGNYRFLNDVIAWMELPAPYEKKKK